MNQEKPKPSRGNGNPARSGELPDWLRESGPEKSFPKSEKYLQEAAELLAQKEPIYEVSFKDPHLHIRSTMKIFSASTEQKKVAIITVYKDTRKGEELDTVFNPLDSQFLVKDPTKKLSPDNIHAPVAHAISKVIKTFGVERAQKILTEVLTTELAAAKKFVEAIKTLGHRKAITLVSAHVSKLSSPYFIMWLLTEEVDMERERKERAGEMEFLDLNFEGEPIAINPENPKSPTIRLVIVDADTRGNPKTGRVAIAYPKEESEDLPHYEFLPTIPIEEFGKALEERKTCFEELAKLALEYGVDAFGKTFHNLDVVAYDQIETHWRKTPLLE